MAGVRRHLNPRLSANYGHGLFSPSSSFFVPLTGLFSMGGGDVRSTGVRLGRLSAATEPERARQTVSRQRDEVAVEESDEATATDGEDDHAVGDVLDRDGITLEGLAGLGIAEHALHVEQQRE